MDQDPTSISVSEYLALTRYVDLNGVIHQVSSMMRSFTFERRNRFKSLFVKKPTEMLWFLQTVNDTFAAMKNNLYRLVKYS